MFVEIFDFTNVRFYWKLRTVGLLETLLADYVEGLNARLIVPASCYPRNYYAKQLIYWWLLSSFCISCLNDKRCLNDNFATQYLLVKEATETWYSSGTYRSCHVTLNTDVMHSEIKEYLFLNIKLVYIFLWNFTFIFNSSKILIRKCMLYVETIIIFDYSLTFNIV